MRRFRSIFLIVSAIMLCISTLAGAQSAQKNKKAKLEKEIAIINSQLKDNASKSSSALGTLSLVRKKISNRQALVAESDKEIGQLDAQIRNKQKEIGILQSRLDTLKLYYERLVSSAYKNRDARLWYMYILGSDNLSQAFRRTSYLHGLSSQMNAQAEKILSTQEELRTEAARLEEMRAEAQTLRRQREKEVQELRSEEAQNEKLVAQLKKDKKRFQKELDTKRKQVEALNREIAKLIKGSNSSGSKGGKKIDYTLDSEFSKNKGKLPWPAEGPVVEGYGEHVHPDYKVKMPFNTGINIATAKDAEVKAVFDGVVDQVAILPNFNQCIIVRHGNYFSVYCKLATVKVKPGDKVKTGQTIATVGTFLGETQLHFEIWKGYDPQNPSPWLR